MFLHNRSKQNLGLATDWVTVEDIATARQVSKNSVRTSLNRMIAAKLVEVQEAKHEAVSWGGKRYSLVYKRTPAGDAELLALTQKERNAQRKPRTRPVVVYSTSVWDWETSEPKVTFGRKRK